MTIKETWIDADAGLITGDSGWYEPYTDKLGDLYRSLQKTYGRCISRMYKDVAVAFQNPVPVKVGWVFQKRVQYTDCADTYLQETWVEYAGI